MPEPRVVLRRRDVDRRYGVPANSVVMHVPHETHNSRIRLRRGLEADPAPHRIGSAEELSSERLVYNNYFGAGYRIACVELAPAQRRRAECLEKAWENRLPVR